jgi:serine/threonine protein kinase
MKGIAWCPHCGKPHLLRERYCPLTGNALEQRIHEVGALPPRKHPLVGRVIDGRYQILRLIGAGGMGEVFEAYNRTLRRTVAIKVVLPTTTSSDAAARLRREARVIAALQHPNICDVYDIGVLPNGNPYLVLERLQGETLQDCLRRERTLAPHRLVEIFLQVLSGLQHAHACGIVHRDLKPANVFLVQRIGCHPLVKLLDFGYAKDLGERRRPVTQPGKTCGTPVYMAPEQLCAGIVDARSDLFSVGIMLYEAITQRHPFHGGTTLDTTLNIAYAPPGDDLRGLADVPSELADVIERTLSKGPGDRPQSAVELQTALAGIDILDGERSARRASGPVESMPQPSSREIESIPRLLLADSSRSSTGSG